MTKTDHNLEANQPKPQPNYYAIVPANVRYCKDLEPSAKLLYGEITALCNTSGYCWASNRHFAELYEVDIRTVKRWLESLKTLGFIKVTMSENKFAPERKIFIVEGNVIIKKISTEGQKRHGVRTRMSKGGVKNVPPNIKANNKANSKTSSSSSSSSSPEPDESSPKSDDASGGDDDLRDREIPLPSDLAAEAGEISVIKTNGKKLTMDQSVIYRHFVNQPYKTGTVREAIKRIKQAEGPINNILKYLECVCKTIEKEQVKKPTTEVKPKNSTETDDRVYTPPSTEPEKTVSMAKFYDELKYGHSRRKREST